MREERSLEDAFLAALGGSPVRVEPGRLGEELRSRYGLGRAAWPRVALEPAAYGRFLAERAVDGEMPPSAHAADLFLACACATGVAGALAAFEEHFGALMSRAVARVDPSASFADETLQVLRQKLFVPAAGGRAQILGYAGRAPLHTWLASAAIRTALKLRRKTDDRGHDTLTSGIHDDLAAGPDPEIAYIRQRYGPHFKAAVRAALTRMTTKDRALLKLHFAQKMSIDRLGALYHVGRSTAARWLTKARVSLLEATRDELCASLGITVSEYESLAAVVRSQLEISAIRYLEESAPSG